MSSKNHNSIQPVFAEPYTALVVTALAVFLVFGQLLSIAHRWVEYPLFYQMNPDFSLRDWLQVYNPFRPGGYRPTAFNLYFQIVSKLFGWQNFPAYQWIAFLFQFFLGACTWLFGRKVLGFDRIAAFFAGLMVSIHPVFFMLPVHLIHFDALYQIFLLLASVIWISSKRFSILRAVAFILLSFLSLSAKEQAVALPAFLVWVFLYDYFFDTNNSPNLVSLKNLGLLVSIVFAAIIIVTGIAYNNGGNDTYRTVMNLPVILKNTLAGFFWIFRIHLFSAPTWPDVRANLYHPAGLLLGIILLSLAALYCKTAISRKRDMRSLWILVGLIGVFFLLPVYSGGRQWHFGIPAIGAMLMSAKGLSLFLLDFQLPRRIRLWLPHIMVLFLVTCSVYEVHRDQVRGHATTRILKEALEHPPVTSEQLPQNAEILYACGSPDSLWAFGDHSLFQYVFQRRDLREYVVPSLAGMDPETIDKIDNLDTLLVFEYQSLRDPSWRNISTEAIPLIHRIKRSETIAPIDSLDLRDATATEFAELEGWSVPETTGRWTSDTVASLRLAVSDSFQSGSDCLIRMGALVNEHHPRMDILVKIDGIYSDNLVLTYPKNAPVSDYRIPIPPETLSDGIINIEFFITSPARPADISDSPDTRLLGLYVQRIDIVEQD